MSWNSQVVVAGVVVCGVRCSWSRAATHDLALTQHASSYTGYENIVKNRCNNTDQVCFVKTVSPAPVFIGIPGFHHLGIQLCLVPGFRDPVSILILGQVTGYGNPYFICLPMKSYTWFLKQCQNQLAPVITIIVNATLFCTEFSTELKNAFLTPVIENNFRLGYFQELKARV